MHKHYLLTAAGDDGSGGGEPLPSAADLGGDGTLAADAPAPAKTELKKDPQGEGAGENEGEVEGDGEDGKPRKDSRIPVSRHKAILEKERQRALEAAQ